MNSTSAPVNAKHFSTRIPRNSLAGRRVLIMGLGSFGGGIAAARWCLSRGAAVTITDLRPPEKLADSLAALEAARLEHPGMLAPRLALGGHCEDDFAASDLVIVNPAVKWNSPYIEFCGRRGVSMTTETNLFLQWCALPVIAITGTKGKSTTTTLTHEILKAAGVPCWLGGNIGRSLLEADELFSPRTGFVVLEISSFQLFAAQGLEWSPRIAVTTHVEADHLDWHGSVEHYVASKHGVIRYQKPGDLFVVNREDPVTWGWRGDTPADVQAYSIRQAVERGGWLERGDMRVRLDGAPWTLAPRNALRLRGDFNAGNFLAASLAAMHAGAPPEACCRVAGEFKGLEHRLEHVGTRRGVDFYNDSIATVPAATLAAMSAMEQPYVLLLGGYDKGLDFTPLAAAVKNDPRLKAVVVLGATRARLRDLFRREASGVPLHEQEKFLDAVSAAAALAAPGDAVLMSPACASYDQFANFQERGAALKQWVAAWPA